MAYLYERLKGLVIIKHLKDCVELPAKTYRRITCKPNASTLRVAKALMESAPNTITGLTWARELSDGFQYRDVPDGTMQCSHCHGARRSRSGSIPRTRSAPFKLLTCSTRSW